MTRTLGLKLVLQHLQDAFDIHRWWRELENLSVPSGSDAWYLAGKILVLEWMVILFIGMERALLSS